MKKLLSFGTLAGFLAISMAFMIHPSAQPSQEVVELKWYTWEEAMELNKTNPKKIMVDVFTDWCGWCKKMDKATFASPEVAEYLTQNFYPVKLNAEQRGDIQFSGQRFAYVETGNGKGVHTLAYALLDGKMSYPTVVYLNEKYERIMISPGYKEPDGMMLELKFAKEERYMKQSFEAYKSEN